MLSLKLVVHTTQRKHNIGKIAWELRTHIYVSISSLVLVFTLKNNHLVVSSEVHVFQESPNSQVTAMIGDSVNLNSSFHPPDISFL